MRVKIFYQADRPCYVYIFSIAEDGSVTLLFPNSLYKDNYVEPGRLMNSLQRIVH
jgi:hypothetical protein